MINKTRKENINKKLFVFCSHIVMFLAAVVLFIVAGLLEKDIIVFVTAAIFFMTCLASAFYHYDKNNNPPNKRKFILRVYDWSFAWLTVALHIYLFIKSEFWAQISAAVLSVFAISCFMSSDDNQHAIWHILIAVCSIIIVI